MSTGDLRAPTARTKGLEFVRRIHRMRTLGLGLGFICVASVFREEAAHPALWALLAANGFVWPHVAFLLARRSPDPRRFELRNLVVDSTMGGVWVALMAFNILPSAILVTMLSIDKISVGGWRLLRQGLSGQALACAATSAAIGFSFAPASSLTVVTACLPMLVAYPVAISTEMYALSTRVRQQKAMLEDLIREEKALRQKLAHSQKLEAIGRLAGGIAHDFNNLLTVILGNGDLLKETVRRDSEARGNLSEILNAANRAAGLTQQLLAFGRRQMLRPKLLRLGTILAETETMLRRLIGEDLELVVERAEGLPLVKADRSQIEQVIVNLALNARDAMPRGGKLTFSLAVVALDEPLVTPVDTVPPGRWVTLEARDTGHGMNAETLARIFEPFFTTKEVGAGTGLGLATVYGIVKQSGGHIEVDSEVGKGTRFRIYLSPAEGRISSDALPVVTLAGGRESVLLVEDEPSVRNLLATQLVAGGYSVLVAADAEEAMGLAGRPGTPVDLLVTDIVMPGMDGAELARRLSEARPGLKVVLVSGYTPDRETAELAAASGWHFVAKPFTPSVLLGAVRAALRGVPS